MPPACHPLTQTDRIRLESLEKQDAYRELAAYMLQQNVKLEQEIISYMEQDSREGKRRYVVWYTVIRSIWQNQRR